tara:strand:+ start:258 stop:380 length:123 start_codon:yes stop_codon:yes gene_type:complete
MNDKVLSWEWKGKEEKSFASAKKIPAHFLKKEGDKHIATC